MMYVDDEDLVFDPNYGTSNPDKIDNIIRLSLHKGISLNIWKTGSSGRISFNVVVPKDYKSDTFARYYKKEENLEALQSFFETAHAMIESLDEVE